MPNHPISKVQVDQLWVKWKKLMKELGSPERSEVYFQHLIQLYSDPKRTYHNCGHILRMLKMFEGVAALALYKNEISLAIWYHDAIYDPTKTDSEEQSKDLFVAHMEELKVPHSTILMASDLIMATVHDGRGINTEDGRLISDLDMAILGSDQITYVTYAFGIRKEYSFVNDDNYRRKRAKVLEGFLDQKRIFLTDHFRNLYEADARVNIQMEIISLQ